MNAKATYNEQRDLQSVKALKGDEALVNTIAELVCRCAFHYLAYGCERKFGSLIDTYTGLPWLRGSEATMQLPMYLESWGRSGKGGGMVRMGMERSFRGPSNYLTRLYDGANDDERYRVIRSA
jgi:hypothetical protein